MKNFSILLIALVMSMVSFNSVAAPSLWKGELTTVQCSIDLAKNGAVGTHKICDLPTKFVVVELVAYAPNGLTGGGSIIIGEDGSGDADGYFTDMDAVTGVVKGTGALVASGKAHIVDGAKDGVLATIATDAYTAGTIEFTFVGYQAK